MSWIRTVFENGKTMYNAAVGNNQEEGTEEAKAAAAAALTRAEASLEKTENLGDLVSATTARTNLGLGTAATQASSAFDSSGAAAAALASAEAFSPQGPAAASFGQRKLGTGSVEARPGNSKTKTRTAHGWGQEAATEATAQTFPGLTVIPATGEEQMAVRCDYSIISGTSATFELKKNGTAITGFTALKAEKTAAHVTPTAVALSEGDVITCTIVSTSGTPKGLAVTLTIEHIAS